MSEELDEAFLAELRGEFLAEASSLLEQCEEAFLKLEDASIDQKENLDQIFRVAHSIKGAGSAVGFTELAHFAHHVEDLLTILRVSPQHLNAEIVSLLLKCGDALKLKVKHLLEKSNEAWDVTELEKALKTLLAQIEGKPAPVDAASPLPEGLPETPVDAPEVQKTVQPVQQKAKTEQVAVVKIDAQKIDVMVNLMGELVIHKSQLMKRIDDSAMGTDLTVQSICAQIDRASRELQDEILRLRLVNLKSLFLKCQRAVRDTADKLKKPINFQTVGEEVEVDRNIVDAITDPLLHMVRNSVDHGIEGSQELRQSRGKRNEGSVQLIAEQKGSFVVLEIRDDGGGIPVEKIFEKAKRLGHFSENTQLADIPKQKILECIFLPGFSTAEKVSDISGRGVGLDVVRSSVEKLKGKLEIDTEVEKGTRFRIVLPVTTSILEGIFTKTSENHYIFPKDDIVEIVPFAGLETLRSPEGQLLAKYRNQVVQLEYFNRLLQQNTLPENIRWMCIMVNNGDKIFGILVEEVLGQIQVVLKPLNPFVKYSEVVSSTTILPDGRVGLVVDLESAIKAAGKQQKVAAERVA
jgi:two-component system chemotaxis sensor kinase CheA